MIFFWTFFYQKYLVVVSIRAVALSNPGVKKYFGIIADKCGGVKSNSGNYSNSGYTRMVASGLLLLGIDSVLGSPLPKYVLVVYQRILYV